MDIERELNRLQELVLRALRQCPRGATNQELEELLCHGQERFEPQTIRTRTSELVDRGLVYDTGERRLTRSGRAAIVWRARA